MAGAGMSAAQPFNHDASHGHTLEACFLGPCGENDALLEKLRSQGDPLRLIAMLTCCSRNG